MEEFHTIDEFGPTDALNFLVMNCFDDEVIANFNPDTMKEKRKQLDYGSHQAETQWEIALKRDIPEAENNDCFICELDFNNTKVKDWSSPEIEHLFPSAFAFLLFGLPGKFHLKWKDERDEASKIITNAAIKFGELMRDLQVKNYKWCHAYCNKIKDASIFIDILEQTDGCRQLRKDKCTVSMKTDKDIKMNHNAILSYIRKLRTSESDRARSWKRSYRGDSKDIHANIITAFSPLLNKLKEYNRDVLMGMLIFNLDIATCIVRKYLRKSIPIQRVNSIKEWLDIISIRLKNGSNMKGGGNEYLNKKFTKEDFEDLSKLGEAIKYYADLPYPGKEEDDAFIKEYSAEYEEEPEVPEVPLRINIPERNNVMNNNGQRAPRVATPRVATPVRGKRSRNNNVNENQNNMRNENIYPSKTLASKKQRVTRDFRPNRRPFAPLGQMQVAGKYKKTRKNRN